MFKTKLLVSIFLFIAFLIITSAVKNKTRIIEKQIVNLNSKIFLKEKDINESQLDFYYLTSPAEIEARVNIIGLKNYEPIIYSKIFFDISDFNNIQRRTSNLKKFYEKNNQN